MTSSELESRNITISMRKSVENLVISSQDAIGQSISQALTFSGVITQNVHQIKQDNRSVSRSPSPSLRNADGSDVTDNEKSETSLQACHAGGDSPSVSISSSELITVVNVTAANLNKGDNPKGTNSNPANRSVDGSSRTKKKSWYNAFYPTYKSKSDDFKRLFKDLPDDERLIVDYSCALQKDILAHGRLYASQNHLCFYASIFGWETTMTLKWTEVTAITKEKTALVIPNAILVCTEATNYFLASFSTRDKAYLMLFRIWQNALMDQPMSEQEIWQWVHRCYGDELGFNSDEEGYPKDAIEDSPAIATESASEDLVDTSSMEANGGGEPREEQRNNRSSSQGRDSSPPLVTNGNGEYKEEAGDILPTDMSDTTDSEPDKPHNNGDLGKCTEPHDGKLIMKQQFPFGIDHLFTMIFTNSRFQLELLAARGTNDYVESPWKIQNGHKCRQISYRLSLSTGPIGPKEVHVTETQVRLVFYSATNLWWFRLSMWPMVKAFMEKSTMSGMEEYSRLLESRLAAEAESTVPAARKARRHRRVTSKMHTASVSREPRPERSSTPWLVGILLVLLLLNGLLYWRLYHSERSHPGYDLDDLQKSSVSSSQMSAWSRLVEQHSVRQRGELRAWRDALHTTIAHLAQTEQALTKLLEIIKPSLEKVQQEVQEHNEL
ncbi:hypothetical protein K1T71_001045 [Dendrolimus kikuchii]|uniref:Uncharacterized protein n=1 Tax=Dendrolimus kikuchii TaxID=765133 RepID=A0ACC1DH27_9NEOP|nr:hypothetical protein K1T71_001045 [Dendrolimus kikuchii]